MKVTIETSNRHIHLSQNHLNILFGENYKLKKLRNLSQPGQFACKETVKIGPFENVRIIGPVRKKTQIEISKSDAKLLNITPPTRMSGKLYNTPKIEVKTDKGKIKASVIISKPHLHISDKKAKQLNLKDGQIITMNKIKAEVKTDPKFQLALHIDTDTKITTKEGQLNQSI